MDPWSKVDYSRLIREASMVVEKLPVVVLPSGRVPGRVLLMLPILEALRQRNRGEIAKKGSVLEGFGTRGIYMRRVGHQRRSRGPRRPPGAARGGAAPGGRLGPPQAPLWPCLGFSGSSRYADFSCIFPRIFRALLIWGKPEIEKQQKTGTGTVVH